MVRTRKRNYDEIRQGEDGGNAKSFVNVRRIAVETWLEVLCWIRCVELGFRVSMASRSLCSLAHVRLFEKCKYLPGNNERSLGSVEIKQNEGLHATSIYINGIDMDLPVDNCFVPENIVRFDKLEIRNVDDKDLTFLRNISHLFVAVKLQIWPWNWNSGRESILQAILPLCSSIQSLSCSPDILCAIQSNFPALLAQCQMLVVRGLFDNKFNSVLSLLLQWLPTGRADGRAKVAELRLWYDSEKKHGMQLIRSLGKQYVDATAPASFIVRITCCLVDSGFEFNPAEHPPMQNSITGEQFTVHFNPNNGWGEVLITRCVLRMSKAVQQEWDVCKQKLIGGECFSDEQKIILQ